MANKSSATTQNSKSTARPQKLKPETKIKTFVIDTSVLLADPKAIFRFAEHEVVIPIIVINELEKKRHDSEIGFFARQALRHLDDLRSEHERLDFPVAVGDGGSLRVELNHIDPNILPVGFQLGDNDSRILAVAANLANEGFTVTVVSKDLPLRVKASALGLTADEYRAEMAVDSGYTGIHELALSADQMAELYDLEVYEHEEVKDLPVNCGLVISSERGHALGGLEAVLERRQHKKIMVFRPLYAVGGQELGYLPGTEAEKMNPWAQAVFDTLGPLVSKEVMEHVVDRGLLEVLPLTHIRGRSLHDSFVIVDEAQSLERNVLLTVLSRIGQNSRVVLTHDVAQRDNLRVGRHDGVASVIEALKGQQLFAHLTLTRSERSPIADMVTSLLDS